MNSAQLLPITDDILKLNRHLDTTIATITTSMNITVTPHNWARLASAILYGIILFNKRRSGEASRMTIQQYSSRPSWSDQGTSELKKLLTPLDTSLANRLSVVEIAGKSRENFKVPVLLTSNMKNGVDKLTETRIAAGIYKENIYIFARGSFSLTPMRGHDCLRFFCKEAHLEKPHLILSTKLRKYVATVA